MSPQRLPFCPNAACRFHVDPRGWRFSRKGFFVRATPPHRIQRYRCSHCHRSRIRRAQLELRFGCPDPRSIEREMAALVALVVPSNVPVAILSDEHPAYPRAFARLRDRTIGHATTPSTARRTPDNPLFPANLLDLLIRHSSANHKRETIAFSKRRQSAAERLFVFVVWRNYLKSFSERRRDATPAQRLGLTSRKFTVEDVLRVRLFPHRIRMPERWADYYWRRIETRRLPNGRRHRLRYAA